MNSRRTGLWFTAVAMTMIGWGVVFTFLGLDVLPVARTVLSQWESALYGAIMIGWGVTLLMVGRVAFRRDDGELKTLLLAGVALWLAIEAVRSALLGVWFNVGVDACVLVLFSVPLVMSPRRKPGGDSR